jgi:hypothetical protein
MEFVFLYVASVGVIVVFDRAFHHVVPILQKRFSSNMELEVYTKTFRRWLILVCVGPVSRAEYLLRHMCLYGMERGELIRIFRSGETCALVGTEFRFVAFCFFRLGIADGVEVNGPG